MEKIKIEIPKKSEYISTLRLTSSSLASKLGFNIDSLEDIKMIISEICIFLINNFKENNNPIEIEFILEHDNIKVGIKDTNITEIKHDIEDMSIMIIKSLSDEVAIKNNQINITKNKLI